MLSQIMIEVETTGDSGTMFRLRVDANVIAEALSAVQAHLLVGEILDRVALPKPDESDERRAGFSAAPPIGRRWRGLGRKS